MTTIWYTSDLHLGHRMVAGLRGFATPEEHDLAVINEWNARVSKRDHVWVLGDVALGGIPRALRLVRGLNGTKHLISGNHDTCHPMHRGAQKKLRTYLEAFDSVQPFIRRRVSGTEVLLSHFPYDTDHTEVSRYTQYRLRDEGAWLLHGHTHGKERRHGYEIHVGLDAWDLRPVSESELALLIQEGEDEKEAARRYMEGPGRQPTAAEVHDAREAARRANLKTRAVDTLDPL